MYYLLILFFASLLGIIFMIGRKLMMMQNGVVLQKEETFLETQYLEKLRSVTIKNIKKHSYAGLVGAVRFYVRFSNFLKNKYQEAKTKIKNMSKEKPENDSPEKKEVSKFLKMISEYKNKIREIKHKIKEEENL